MSTEVLVSGSQLQYADPLGEAKLVAPVMRTLSGSGRQLTIGGQPVLVEGDTTQPPMPGNYLTSSHSLPGGLLLNAKAERDDQLSTKLTVGGKKVVLAVKADSIGQMIAPAMKPNPPPAPPEPDSTASYDAAKHATPRNPAQKFTTI